RSLKNTAIVAPTGVAALNVGGQTIHSFFKFAPILHEVGSINTVDSKTKEILQALDALVVDEVSMVSADLMEAMSEKLKLARRNDKPFGGIQMILFGDLYQLPPVVSDGQAKRYLDDTFGGSYFFNSHAYKECNVIIKELQEVFRQKDEFFKGILNEIRSGKVKDSTLSALNERAKAPIPDSGFITLAGTNRAVYSVNSRKLSELPGEVKNYEATISGDIKESSFPTEKNLKLKIGAQIMLLKNDTKKPARWVNGTLGVVTKLSSEGIKIRIKGVEHTVYPATWEKIQYDYDHETKKLKKKIVSSFQQLPVRLAWAVTIHKSQGQTYDLVTIDLSEGAFAHGQSYVALSRCTTLEGLYLESPLRREDIIVDPDVVEFMKNKRG
ncbi:AAA family ATPase, partial [Candidatus Saccharibacteria bacterium]|nr:AAA family ATPase [Candidatus Saccharibacteria bacterium]